MAVETVVGVSVAVTSATTPGAIVFAFMPVSMHVYVPGAPLQERDFPAAVDASPILTDSAATSKVE